MRYGVMIAGVSGNDLLYHQHKNKNYMREEFIALTNAHRERLLALMDKPVVLFIGWEDGDGSANVKVMPVDAPESDADKPFETFDIKFPVEV